MPPAVIAAAPPAAAKLDLKSDRRSRSCILGARLIPPQFIVTVKLLRHVTLTAGRRNAELQHNEVKEKQTFAYCLSLACSNLEKYGHRFDAKSIHHCQRGHGLIVQKLARFSAQALPLVGSRSSTVRLTIIGQEQRS